MKNSYLIWIPSIQNFLRFKELDYDQFRCLLKVLEDKDLELIYILNEIIKTNIISEFDIKTLTTLDRFIIFLSLKIHSCGPTISLTKKCSKCETSTGIKMDLNQLIENIAPKIDKKFTQSIRYGDITAICDIPSIETEYQIYSVNNMINVDIKSLDFRLENYITTYISHLQIGDTLIDLNSLEYMERMALFQKLPAGLTHRIYHNFLKQIHDSVTEIDFLSINCQKCKEFFEIKFDVSNINDILKIVYKDNNVESILQTIVNISTISKGISDTIFRLSPLEVDILNSIVMRMNKTESASESPHTTPPPEKNLFEEYRAQSAGLQESQSEFVL